MAEHPFPTPGVVVAAALGFLAGGVSLGFNPFFAVSLIAVILSGVALIGVHRLPNVVAQGVLRILAILGIMGGVGGVMVLLFPGLGVGATVPGSL